VTCEACGKLLAIGEWPFCGGKNNHGFPLAGINIIDDELPNGPYLCETLGHEDVYVTSKSHLRREAEARGLENVVRHDDHYYRRQRKQHDEWLRDTGQKR
jgi:hypothetical protein